MKELTPLPQLVVEIKILSQQTAANIIEIGKRLIQAKEQVAHGEWGGWIEQNTDFTRMHASRIMRAAEEFSNVTSLLQMPPTKVFALLDVPAADRENFLAATHEVGGQQKTVDEMTSRELAATIKALKEAEKASVTKDAEIQRQSQRLQKLEEDLEKSKIAQKMLADLKKPDTVTVEKRVEVIPPDYEATKKKLKEAQAEIDKMADERIGQAQAVFKAGKRAEIRSRIVQLAREVGKVVKEIEFLSRAIPGDEDITSDLSEGAAILRETADALEGIGTKKGVTLDAEHFVTN
jgi:hypothetical protein